jgi:hypothetical protein
MKQKRIFILTDIDLDYPEYTLNLVTQLYNKGLDIYDIAHQAQIDTDQVALIIFDQARKGVIERRSSGIWGA